MENGIVVEAQPGRVIKFTSKTIYKIRGRTEGVITVEKRYR